MYKLIILATSLNPSDSDHIEAELAIQTDEERERSGGDKDVIGVNMVNCVCGKDNVSASNSTEAEGVRNIQGG